MVCGDTLQAINTECEMPLANLFHTLDIGDKELDGLTTTTYGRRSKNSLRRSRMLASPLCFPWEPVEFVLDTVERTKNGYSNSTDPHWKPTPQSWWT